MTTELTTATMRRFRWKKDWNWAEIDFDQEGRLRIASSYGSWSCRWTGNNGDVRRFLAGLSTGYLSRCLEIEDVVDTDKTLNAVRSWILEARREEELDAFDARYEWNGAAELETSVDAWLSATEIPDAWEMVYHKLSPQWTAFYEGPWQSFRTALEAELEGAS